MKGEQKVRFRRWRRRNEAAEMGKSEGGRGFVEERGVVMLTVVGLRINMGIKLSKETVVNYLFIYNKSAATSSSEIPSAKEITMRKWSTLTSLTSQYHLR
ncbi:hypothetical protein L1987_24483 [Smallanthus sonchifolius]|uniref:Uncharacterized protein n=1 Tax=Smallanthus sonchifolius TaxID=185202 RepID=A0ACB9IM26_9ASTR|nr:hypothetical protein L1987_24483 [Smallanthus sonchifolius]